MTDDYSNATILPLRDYNGTIVAFTLVDKTDLETLSKKTWRLLYQDTNRCYAVRSIWNDGSFKTFRLHRVLLNEPTGDVDHKNGCGLDNRRCNLRAVTHAQNMLNRVHKAEGKTSKYIGVCFDKSRNKWKASIMVNYKSRQLGRFLTEQEAANAVQVARKELLESFSA